jgi:glycosyltransferase involved in cell wall biosynthesis
VSAAPPRRLHLLEVGLHWPPETYLQWKFARLAAAGMRVTVASRVPRRKAGGRVPGAELQRVPSWSEPSPRAAAGLIVDALGLLAGSPRKLAALVAAVRRTRGSAGERLGWRAKLRVLRSFLRLAGLRPDVVHFEWVTAAVDHLPLLEVWKRPVVISLHGDPAEFMSNPRWRHGIREALRRADAVHCVSEAVRRQSTSYGTDPAKAWLIRPAIDPEFFTPNGRTTGEGDGPLRLLSVGRLHWIKGYEYALQAVRLLLDRGMSVRLEIAGEGPDRDRIAATVDDLGLHRHVELLGALDSSAVRSRLRGAGALVNSSVSEGIPTSLLEAMACSVPVVASDCGGVAEAVTDGREGLLVAPRDPAAMAAALERLARDPGLRERMGRAGRARVEADFAIDRQVAHFVEMYEHLRERVA